MTYQDLLDDTITDPAPPFLAVDGLISRERHRHRRLRVAAMATGAASVLAVVLGVTAIVGTGGATGLSVGNPPQSTVTTDPTVTPSPSTGPTAALPDDPEGVMAHLADVLRAQLSTVVPDATAAPNGLGSMFELSASHFAEVDAYEGAIEINTAAAGYSRINVTVLRPHGPFLPPTSGVLARFYGGCLTMWSDNTQPTDPDDQTCREEQGVAGARIAMGERHLDGYDLYQAIAVFPGGGAVSASLVHLSDPVLRPDDPPPVLTLEQLAALVNTPAYLT